MTLTSSPAPGFPDLTALLDDLRTLTLLESPSGDEAGITAVMDVVEGWARDLGAEVRHHPGGTREFRFGVGGEERPLLVLTHGDTVWARGTLEGMPWRVEGDRVYGPGTYDMKAGLVGLFHALRDLGGPGGQAGWPRGGITVLLSPDEEVGSDLSRPQIEAAARESRAALVVEPPVADSHNLKTGRKGTGGFTVTLRGIAAHAGNKPAEGASAITAAAEAVLALQALARPDLGTTVSVGTLSGGSAVNVIPAQAELRLDLRVSTLAEGERVTAAVQAWRPSDPRVTVEVQGGLNRPPFEQGEGTLRLYEQARAIARDLGFELGHEVVGGGSDGNLTAPLTPTLDGLGAPGDGAHAAHEHVRLDRWPDHVRLLRRLLGEV